VLFLLLFLLFVEKYHLWFAALEIPCLIDRLLSGLYISKQIDLIRRRYGFMRRWPL
jgi:hypothetical protein